jgi:hypothetical protein
MTRGSNFHRGAAVAAAVLALALCASVSAAPVLRGGARGGVSAVARARAAAGRAAEKGRPRETRVAAGRKRVSAAPATFTSMPPGLVNATLVDTHSPGVAMAVDAGVTQLNALRAKTHHAALRVINILAAKRAVRKTSGRTVFIVTLQLRKTGGRMEFQILEVAEVPPSGGDPDTAVDAHPPMTALPPTSEAIIMTAQFHPPVSADAAPPTYKLLGNKMIVSPFSMRHRRSRSSLEPASGSAATVMKAMQEAHKPAPMPTPPE